MKSTEMKEWLGFKKDGFDNTVYTRITRKQLAEFKNLNKLIHVLDSNLFQAVLLKPNPYYPKVDGESTRVSDSFIIGSKVDPDPSRQKQYLIYVKYGVLQDPSGNDCICNKFYKITIVPNELDSFRTDLLEQLSNKIETPRPYNTITVEEQSELLRTLVREIRHALCYDSRGKLSKSMATKTINHVRISIMHLYFWNEDQKVVKIDLDYSSNRNPNALGSLDVRLSILFNHNTNTLLWADKYGSDASYLGKYITLSLDGVIHFFYFALYGYLARSMDQ